MKKQLILILGMSVLLSACSFLQTASISSIPKDRKNMVETSASRTVFLGFNFDNDYIDNIPLALARQCPDGVVRGILTKHETVSYFIVNKHIVSAKGFCTTN